MAAKQQPPIRNFYHRAPMTLAKQDSERAGQKHHTGCGSGVKLATIAAMHD